MGADRTNIKSTIQGRLEIEDVNTERAHRVGNTNRTLPRAIIVSQVF